jgi:hypothetical protein
MELLHFKSEILANLSRPFVRVSSPSQTCSHAKRVMELPYLGLATHGLAVVIVRLLVRARVRSSLAVGHLLVRSNVTLLRLAGIHRVTGWHPLYNA